jgi:hypothetical protein
MVEIFQNIPAQVKEAQSLFFSRELTQYHEGEREIGDAEEQEKDEVSKGQGASQSWKGFWAQNYIASARHCWQTISRVQAR